MAADRMFRDSGCPRLLVVALQLIILLIASQRLLAQSAEPDEPRPITARKVAPTSFDIPPTVVALPKLPLAFSKTVPETITDLQEMESHVQSLVALLTETTVALTVENAQGSGVIVSEDGYVLTAAHVSGEPGRKVTITLADGTRALGRSLGCNRTLDASLIKIESPQRKWPYVAMSRLDAIGVGDWSIVMGHPGGHQPGRAPVFRLGRVIHVDRRIIQTDNELVGGDSGGPLFDMRGRVIGINSRIGTSTSFNLHTPINVYRKDWERLVASENFVHHSGALLGVAAEPDKQGLKLTRVWSEEPAGRAGLREGDILLRFEDERVHSLDQLIELVGEYEPGESVRLRILRQEEVMELTVELGSRNLDGTDQP